MNAEEQNELDHQVCFAVMHAFKEARGHEECLHLGDTVSDFRMPISAGGRIVSGAKVEQRHLDAIAVFQKNYPLGYEIGSVRLRIEPPASAEQSA